MFAKRNHVIVTKILSMVLVLLLVLPTAVFADDGNPANEPATAATAEAPAAAPAETPTGNSVPVDAPADAPQADDNALAEETSLPAPQVTTVEDVDLSAVVEALEVASVVIVDEAGNEVPLASQDAAEILLVPDPYIERGGVNYRFMSDCSAYPDSPTSVCTVSATPIQAALAFSLNGETIKIDQGHYNEDVIVNKNVIFSGLGTGATARSITLNSVIGSATSGFTAALVVVNAGAKIADGIKLVSENGTVEVAAGTFAEQLDINKSMKLKGAGADKTIIVPDPAYAHCWGPSCGPGDRTLVEINGGDERASGNTINVLLDGFTLDGQYAYGMKFGVLVHGGAFAEVSNNTVKNFYDHAYPGGNQVNMLVGYEGQDWPWSGSAGRWHYTGHGYFHNNFVTGFNTVGMMIWGPNSTGTFDSNIISPDPSDTHLSAGAMGIVLQQSGNAVITNNLIQNLVTLGGPTGGSYRSAMEAYWPGNTLIAGNVFDGNDYAFAMYNKYPQPVSTGMSIDDNTFSNNGVGVQFGGTNVVSFGGNRIFGNSIAGVVNTMQTLVDARGNWWGSADGPGALPGATYLNNGGLGAPTGSGDGISDFLLYDPYLKTDPSEETPDGGGADPAPLIIPPADLLGLIPVTGGQLVQLPCTSECITLRLPDGSWAEFCGLCGYSASLSEELEETLPYTLPVGSSMLKGMTVQLLDADQKVLEMVPAGATLKVGFPIEAGVEAASLKMNEYDLVNEDWMELAASGWNGWMEAYTNMPGTVILIQ